MCKQHAFCVSNIFSHSLLLWSGGGKNRHLNISFTTLLTLQDNVEQIWQKIYLLLCSTGGSVPYRLHPFQVNGAYLQRKHQARNCGMVFPFKKTIQLSEKGILKVIVLPPECLSVVPVMFCEKQSNVEWFSQTNVNKPLFCMRFSTCGTNSLLTLYCNCCCHGQNITYTIKKGICDSTILCSLAAFVQDVKKNRYNLPCVNIFCQGCLTMHMHLALY